MKRLQCRVVDNFSQRCVLLAACLSAHRTMINGSAPCAARLSRSVLARLALLGAEVTESVCPYQTERGVVAEHRSTSSGHCQPDAFGTRVMEGQIEIPAPTATSENMDLYADGRGGCPQPVVGQIRGGPAVFGGAGWKQAQAECGSARIRSSGPSCTPASALASL